MYRIYQVSAKFTHVHEDEVLHDSSSAYLMPRDRKDRTAYRQTHEWWARGISDLEQVNLTVLSVGFSHEATWCPEWFHHWTWDTGQTDGEAFASFNEYVMTMQRFNQKQGHYFEFGERRHWIDKVCLQGAEDRWRWRASKDDENPPCRCEHCKAKGILRIEH